MNENHKLIVLSCIDYSGKSFFAEKILEKKEAIHIVSGLSDEEKIKANSGNYKIRFKAFWDMNLKLDKKVKKILETDSVLMERGWFDTIATHNYLLKTNLENGQYIKETMLKLTIPDLTIMLYIDHYTIRTRMEDRPPEHLYESSIQKLMADQVWYMALGNKLQKEIGFNINYINNSLTCQTDALKEVLSLTDFLPYKS